MESVVLVIHLILALAIIALVLLQRSEGGGLGIGGSGGLGGFATAAGTANALTRATAVCAGLFFVTSLVLAVLAGAHRQPSSLIESLDKPAAVIDSPKAEGDPEETPADPASESSSTSSPKVPISE